MEDFFNTISNLKKNKENSLRLVKTKEILDQNPSISYKEYKKKIKKINELRKIKEENGYKKAIQLVQSELKIIKLSSFEISILRKMIEFMTNDKFNLYTFNSLKRYHILISKDIPAYKNTNLYNHFENIRNCDIINVA